MQRPDVASEKPRKVVDIDFAPDLLRQWAQSQWQYPRISRLLSQRATPILLPGSLRGAVTREEMSQLTNGQNLVAAFWEIADLSDSILLRIPYRERNGLGQFDERQDTFDISMVLSHMSDQDGTVVESTPANTVQIHLDSFSPDPKTQALIKFITSREAQTCNPASAHILEIPGILTDEDLSELKEFLREIKDSGWGHISDFQRPQLGHALQSAIARSKATYPSKPSAIVTETAGPGGSPITVYSSPQDKVALGELSEGYQPSNLPLTKTFLVRPMFSNENEKL